MAIDKIESAGLETSTNQPNFRNIIINGDMSIAQRATSASSISSSGYQTVDRFINEMDAAGTWTISQSTTVPSGQGFATSLKMDCTTANGSLSAGSYNIFSQRLEGQILQYLKFGTSSAESLTLSFWVRSNKTGTYTLEINSFATNKSQSQTYTISSADTWEKKTVTFTGDTATTIANDNARSLNLMFWLAAGTTYTSGTLNTSFNTKTDANRVSSSQVNLADSTSNEWYVTGVQLEAGTIASDFEFLPVDANLLRCQRYLQKIEKESSNTVLTVLQAYGSETAIGCLPAITKFRALPSLSTTGTFNCWTAPATDNAIGSIGLYSAATTQNGFIFTRSSQGSLSAGNATGLHTQSTATILFDAEL